MPPPTVLIADDHTILAEGLARLLKDHFDVVGTVADGDALLDMADRLRPDVIITDLEMPSVSGIDAVSRLRTLGVMSKVIILTMHGESGIAARALRAGASGFLLKDSAGEELVERDSGGANGRVYLTPAVTQDVLDTWREGEAARREDAHRAAARRAAADRRGPADEGDCRRPRTVHPHGRNAQVRDDARPRRAVDRGARSLRDQAPSRLSHRPYGLRSFTRRASGVFHRRSPQSCASADSSRQRSIRPIVSHDEGGPRPRVLLAEDQPANLALLESLLDTEFDVVATVADGIDLVDAAARLLPDAIVTDITMPRLDGLRRGATDSAVQSVGPHRVRHGARGPDDRAPQAWTSAAWVRAQGRGRRRTGADGMGGTER